MMLANHGPGFGGTSPIHRNAPLRLEPCPSSHTVQYTGSSGNNDCSSSWSLVDSALYQRLRRLYLWRILVILVLALLLLGITLNSLSSMQQSEQVVHLQLQAEKTFARQRLELYERMACDLDRVRPTFLDSGGTSQSLKLSDLFQIRGGKVKPVLKPVDPAVRAVVLHMDPKSARLIFQVLRETVFWQFSEDTIWRQDPELYHFSMYHTSHHTEPVPATKAEIQAEADAIQAVSHRLIPLKVVLQRVVLTSTGVLLGLWEVVEGPDPAVIRSELKKALPLSPERQLYDSVMLHTSFARILGLPERMNDVGEAVPFLKGVAQEATNGLAGLEVELKELWFVEELDVLALALNGRIVAHKFSL